MNNHLDLQHKKQITPFLKWAGGKSQLIEQYRRFFPHTLEGRRYVEPFVGSGAVFFHVIQNLHPASCTLLDANEDLINTWREIRDHVGDVITLLEAHKARHNAPGITQAERKTYYYEVRALTPRDKAARAARFIYLNKTCFNGLHRLNSKGEFNVPIGSYTRPAIADASHLRTIAHLLQGVTLETCPFQECGRYIADGDFVYLDPPYEPLSKTSSFASYTKGGFTRQHQTELRDFLHALNGRVDWMLSNSTAPFITALYAAPGFHQHNVLASRTINSNATRRGKIKELLITSYPTGT